METWEVSLWGWNKARHPIQKLWNWSMMRTRLVDGGSETKNWPEYHSKNELPAWSPTIYKKGSTRGAKNVVAVTCLVLDFDDGTPFYAAADVFEQWPFLLHTSWSHTDELHKWRIILPLERPVPVENWSACFNSALELWKSLKPAGAGNPDPKCSDPCRIYYLPAKRNGSPSGFGFEHDDPDYCTWPLQLDAKSQKKPPKKVFVPKRTGIPDSEKHRRIQQQFRYKNDPDLRLRAAEILGGKVIESSGVVRGIQCPKCGDPSVWYAIDPSSSHCTARCNHQNSCGWWGHLYDLNPSPKN